MIGAPALAGNASLRAGCGLCQIVVPEAVQNSVAILASCATTMGLSSDRAGRFAVRCADAELRSAVDGWADVVACGPGMGQSNGAAGLVAWVLKAAAVPLVLDADGLNNACRVPGALRMHRAAQLVLTPHVGEMERLLASQRLRIDPTGRRREAAVRLARQCRAVVVLKGHRTLVTDGQRVYENTTGNPGMATGGCGDVLTGMIASWIAQGLDAFDASVLGVFAHGRAGDLGARALGEDSLIAWDLLDYLPAALKRLRRAR